MKTLRRLLFPLALAITAPLFGQQVVGNLTVQQYVRNADGTAAAPSFRFTTDPNTGFYSPGADQIGIAANGLAQGYFSTSGLTLLDLTATRVTFAGASGLLSDDADFTFATDTLTITKIAATQFTGIPSPTAGLGFGTTALRWGASYFSGPIYVGAASGTSPTITATGSSPNESLVFTFAGTGGAIISTPSDSQLYLNALSGGQYSTLVLSNNLSAVAQFSWDNTPKLLRISTDVATGTIGFYTGGGILTTTLSGDGAATITGGAGNMTITSGTGNSRTMTFRTTTSGGTATTALTLDASQNVAIKSTSPISGVRTATATLNFASILTAGYEDLTITVTGAAVNDVVDLGPPAVVGVGAIFNAWVSAADTVTVRCNNAGSIAVDPASATYRVSAMSF